jgi:sugar phosphate isomerase/epimerase
MKTPYPAPFPLGVSFHTLDLHQRPEAAEILAESSVKSVELWEPTFGKGEGLVQQMRRAFAAAEVEVRTVHANFGASMDISSPDSAVRATGIQAFATALDLAAQMGARTVIVHASSEPVEDGARAERMKQAIRSIETIAEMAGQAGCRIALELLPRTCLGRSTEELLTLVEGVDPGAAGVCLDTNHLMDRFASLPEVVRTLGPRLFALHCSDYDGVDEKHWPPLRGVIDWAAFLSALRATGFSGPFLYEATLEGQTPAERLAFLERNYAQLVSRTGSGHAATTKPGA